MPTAQGRPDVEDLAKAETFGKKIQEKIEGYSFLEQNPKKSSHWAKLAREGSLIMWIVKGRRYLGQVRDGTFYDLRKKKE
jgi:hypothetical protein